MVKYILIKSVKIYISDNYSQIIITMDAYFSNIYQEIQYISLIKFLKDYKKQIRIDDKKIIFPISDIGKNICSQLFTTD